MDDVYELFQRGMRLLEAGDFHQATVPLGKAATIEPEKTSIREALGRALFRSRSATRRPRPSSRRSSSARRPTTTRSSASAARCIDCGRHGEARKPLALAANLRPDRRDYRIYRDRRARAARPWRDPSAAVLCLANSFRRPRWAVGSESGRIARFFVGDEGDDMSAIQAEIEARLATAEPEVEVLLAEVVGGRRVRLFIDHPDGVTLELCERVTHSCCRRSASATRSRSPRPGPSAR